jgi:hypothetical protein
VATGCHNIRTPLMDISMARFFPLSPIYKSIPFTGVMLLDCTMLQYMLDAQFFHQFEPITRVEHTVSELWTLSVWIMNKECMNYEQRVSELWTQGVWIMNTGCLNYEHWVYELWTLGVWIMNTGCLNYEHRVSELWTQGVWIIQTISSTTAHNSHRTHNAVTMDVKATTCNSECSTCNMQPGNSACCSNYSVTQSLHHSHLGYHIEYTVAT